MNISSLSAYTPYVNRITNYLDTQTAAAQQSIDELHRVSASYEVRISDYGMIQSGLSNLESAARKLSGPDAFSFYSAISTDTNTLTAYAQKNASPGTYDVTVSQLAQGETLASAAQSNPFSAIGSGSPATVVFQFANGSSRSVTIDQSNNTLQGIAASINQADFGIFASVAYNGSAFQLLLRGPSGNSNAFNIGVSGEEAVARLLSYSNGAANNAMTQTMAAQDSQGSVDGTLFTGYSNVITGVAEGLTLNLSRTGQAAITVAIDMAQTANAVQSFVDAYNRSQNDLAMYRTGELPDDQMMAEISNRLTAGLNTAQPASDMSLEQIGITRNQDGTLAFDAMVFQGAYSRNPAGVAHLFTGNGNGLADQVSAQLQNALQPSGSISSTIDQLLSNIRGNQQMEKYIEDKAFRDLQYSAHHYAQQLAMIIVAHIVSQFMQDASSQPANHPGTTPGTSGLETLMSELASRYNTPSPAANPGAHA